MTVKTLATQEELGLQFDFIEKSELGTFQVKTNELKDHLEVTRSLFALAHNTRGMHNHARWVLGDVLQASGALHGDDYNQELDTFAELINWDSTKITEVIRTSKTYWSAEMRKLSYDPHTWEYVYGTKGGEHSPLEWSVYDAVSRNIGEIDDRALDLLSYILWCQGYTQSRAKSLIKLIACEDEGYTEEIAKIAQMAPMAQRDYITDLKNKHKDTAVRGKYLALTIEKDHEGTPQIVVSRQVDVDEYVLQNSEMIIHKTAREYNLITGFEKGKPVSQIIPTGDVFE